ncbi:MAG: SSU ribosomal protein S1p [uncultured Chloroflexia bacterium]|uniref:SSU ribosomal protein S1p n=1 Tax=uncultured Chloroflexia bacterium TaxID=1672391 RepID=A0A6J4JRM2_9CHLR|nr:MAG: SSU ribosomal protein S1p [uncultured Chloroflexia bacterium]
MTDAERTSAQAEEQEQATQNGGLLSRIVDTARSVVETVAERAPEAVSSAAAVAGGAVGAVVEKVRDLGATEPASQAETPAVVQDEAATAEALPVAAVEESVLVAVVDEGATASAPVVQDEVVDVEVLPVAVAEEGVLVAVVDESPAVSAPVVPDEVVGVDALPIAVVETSVPDAAVADATTAVVPAGPDDAAEPGGPILAVADAVRRRVSRVYGAITAAAGGQASPDQQPPAAPAGATYQPETEGAKGGRPRRFKDVQPGMQLQGKVTSIALYGIFVDVGVGRDGLVHISEMSDQRVETPTDLVQIGTPVDVWVKSVDPDARRISLTMRDPNRQKPERSERRGPRKREINRERLAELKAGDSVEGTISSLAPFGAFVDIGVGKDGLVHVSELTEGRVERPEDAVQVGERYTFKILEVDPDGNRISLSLRRAQRSQRIQQLEPGTLLEGKISGIAPFGAFVDVGVGRDGLVHVSELASHRVNSVEEIVKVGDAVKVKVIEVDPNSKRISLTMRVDEPMPNERERPAPRAAEPSFGGGDRGPSFSPAPSFSPPPAFGEGRSFDDGRGADRGARRGGGFREGGREGGRDFSRPEGRGVAGGRPRRDRADQGGGRGGRSEGGRGRGDGDVFRPAEEVYSFEDPEETFSGDATLEDLLSKFNSGKGKDSRRERDEDEDEAGNTRADAIRRTLALRDEE